MKYPRVPDYRGVIGQIELYAQLLHERGARGVEDSLARTHAALREALAKIRRLPVDKELAGREPDRLDQIRLLRPPGPRRLWRTLPKGQYAPRLEGALLGRMAGCTLGAPVECWSLEQMGSLATANGDPFPPTDYWRAVPDPDAKRYGVSPRRSYTRGAMDGVPVDDDIVYTLLGLLIVEDHGPAFTTDDVARAWLKYLPHACTAEAVALDNLRRGAPAGRAGGTDNPYCEWLGADIRSDPWGYLAPGWPERAARMAYRDAFLSHRRQGVYGAMFFAAAISAAFAVDDPVEAIRIGLTEIPRQCTLARAVRWALRQAPRIADYRQARAAVDRQFPGMHPIHTVNNACLTVWGLTIGGRDFSRIIGQTVAMGLDNDCTAATAGSIAGAALGVGSIPRRWYARFHNTVHSYLTGRTRFTVTGLLKRFARQANLISRQA